ncbi:Glutathione S-transferase class-mu 28 kDa isozyme (GST 28) (Sj28 antigen) (Sj28GST) (Fragment) [Durusdinium trenchii]|uniref:Glutathione S-transferase class-mu 28 kDa isozyme (GST 28) (Sj28 antigen) (Sj28GST) n=1 Tax=Durusdinium trenchii TaxID=1381693 RepID=A0ABP0I392_9DINO
MALKLTYFNFSGRAGTARIALKLAGQEFEDERIDFKELIKRKETGELPLGAVPVLTVGDSRPIAQHTAIIRFVARLTKLYPEDAFQALLVDELIESVDEVPRAMGSTFGLKGEELIKQRQALLEDGAAVNKVLKGLEKMCENVNKTGFVVGDSRTVADLAVWNSVGQLNCGNFDGFPLDTINQSNFPNLLKVYNAVAEDEAVPSPYDPKF